MYLQAACVYSVLRTIILINLITLVHKSLTRVEFRRKGDCYNNVGHVDKDS